MSQISTRIIEGPSVRAQNCQCLDGSALIVLMLATLGAMIAGWSGAFRNLVGRGTLLSWHLGVTVLGAAGTIVVAGALQSSGAG